MDLANEDIAVHEPPHQSTCRFCCPVHDELRAEVERLRDVAWKHGNRADEAEVENRRECVVKIERLKAEVAWAEDRIKTLEAENGPLRRDLEHAQSTLADYEQILDQGRAENERLRSGLDHNLKLIKHLQASDLYAEVERLSLDNRRLTEMWDADRETLTAEVERLRTVASAANDILEILHWTPEMHPKIVALGVALKALDD